MAFACHMISPVTNSMVDNKRGLIGIVAGRGELPRILIQCCRLQGIDVFVLALNQQTDPLTVEDVPHAWVRLGALGKAMEILKNQGVQSLVFAGGVTRPSWLELRPDWRAAEVLSRIGVKAFGDDGALSTLIQVVEQEGFQVMGAQDLMGELLASAGVIGHIVPSQEEMQDIARGAEVVRALGSVDVGQAVVVQQGIVLAVEAAEGTDAMLSRCVDVRQQITGLKPGGVLVKMAKLAQEQRIDLPSIGPDTIEKMDMAGLRGVALEAGRCLVINKKEVIQRADALGLFLFGIKGDQQKS